MGEKYIEAEELCKWLEEREKGTLAAFEALREEEKNNAEGLMISAEFSVFFAARKHVETTPAADVEKVRHGAWIIKDEFVVVARHRKPKIIKHHICSICGREEKQAEPYCHCGAKMDLKEGE